MPGVAGGWTVDGRGSSTISNSPVISAFFRSTCSTIRRVERRCSIAISARAASTAASSPFSTIRSVVVWGNRTDNGRFGVFPIRRYLLLLRRRQGTTLSASPLFVDCAALRRLHAPFERQAVSALFYEADGLTERRGDDFVGWVDGINGTDWMIWVAQGHQPAPRKKRAAEAVHFTGVS